MSQDLIDSVLAIAPDSHLDRLRRHREVARDNTQKAYIALFEPANTSDVSVLERFAIAAFVTGLHGPHRLADHYARELAKASAGAGTDAVISTEIAGGKTEGPYGAHPKGPLSGEDKDGLIYSVSAGNREVLGAKLSAALEHAHLLVYRPRDASKAALEALQAAGWSTAGIVTISQLVAFLSFQVRIVQGLSVLAANPAADSVNQSLPKAEAAIA